MIRYIGGTQNGQIVLSMPYTAPNDDWVHFGVTIGYGVLYFIDSTNARFRRTEGLHAWYADQDYHQHTKYDETDNKNSIFAGRASVLDTKLVISISLKAFTDSAMTTEIKANNFGLRIWEVKDMSGSYLGYLIANPTFDYGPTCFLKSILDRRCYMYVFLKGENDFNPNALKDVLVSPREAAGCPIDKCRYCLYTFQCNFAVSGYNEDLYINQEVLFIKEGWKFALYNPANPVIAAVYVRVLNNQNREYWVRCPPNCKNFRKSENRSL